MSIGKHIAEQMEHASWIRRMFEIGARMKRERGEENVFDFTLGNPDGEPPEEVIAALRRVVDRNPPRSHAYMPNAGFPAVREVIARQLSAQTGLAYTADHILMTVGAAGAINVVLKSLLDPGDEVIILVPFFPEYQFYIENHAGRMVLVETDDTFQPSIGRIAAAITPRTKAIILDSPNNPTGVVYSAEFLRDLDALISGLDHAFVRGLMNEGILAVPGQGFGRAGYFRLSLTIPLRTIERALPGFERALHKLLAKH